MSCRFFLLRGVFLQCPINTFDRGIVAARTSINSCEYNPGFFRADDKSTLKIALSQNILSSLNHSNRIWCIFCPFGYWCNPRGDPTDISQTKRTQTYRSVHLCLALAYQEHIHRLSVCVLLERMSFPTLNPPKTPLRPCAVIRAYRIIIARLKPQSQRHAHARL